MKNLKKFQDATSDYPYPFPYPYQEKNKGNPNVAIDYPSKKPIRFNMTDGQSQYPYPYPDFPSAPDDPVIALIQLCQSRDSCPVLSCDDLPDNYMEMAKDCKIAVKCGCPLYLQCFSEAIGSDIGWQDVFEFEDNKVLDLIIDNFRSIKDLNPPLVLGHDEMQSILQNSGYPSAGWITDLKRKESSNILMAKFSNVPPEIVKLVESKAYSKVSAELYVDYVDASGKHYGPTLRRVAILGADIPHIKTLNDLCVIYNTEDNLQIKTFSMEDSMDVKLMEELKVKESAILKLQEDSKASEQKILSLSEKLTLATQKLELASGALTSSRKERILNDLNTRFTPAMVEDLSKVLTFSEDDVALTVVKLFENHLEKGSLIKPIIPDRPTVAIDIHEQTSQGDPISALHTKIMAFAEKEKIAYEDAYNRMSHQGLIRI